MLVRKFAAFAVTLLVLVVNISAQSEMVLPERFPEITVNVNRDPAPGYIYMANFRRAEAEPDGIAPFLMVLDAEGTPVFFQHVPPLRAFNFGRTVNGERYYYLLADEGLGSGAAFDGVYNILDNQGNIVRQYRATEGMPTQAHEFVALEDGGVILVSQPAVVRDLSEYGGSEEALVVENVIQEFDADGALVFEWRSWEHVSIEDTVARSEFENIPPMGVSYMHVNALTIDLDGNLIISARRFDELIKIDRKTGEIIWRLGGPASHHNEFTFIDDPQNGFSGQHNPSILPNGNLLLFDNGTLHEERVSRVVEYELDQVQRTASLVWQYSDGRYSGSMGSVQRLPNGHTLIGWGSAPPTGPSVTEVNPEGEVVYALSLPPTQINYRAYKFDE